MQRAEMEELRQRDANLTALQAIGPRKKPKLESDTTTPTAVSPVAIATVPTKPKMYKISIKFIKSIRFAGRWK